MGALLGAGIGAIAGTSDSSYSYRDRNCTDYDFVFGCEGYVYTKRTKTVRTTNSTSTVVGAVVGGLAGGLVGFLIAHENNKEAAAEVRVGGLTIDLRHIDRGTVAVRFALPQ